MDETRESVSRVKMRLSDKTMLVDVRDDPIEFKLWDRRRPITGGSRRSESLLG